MVQSAISRPPRVPQEIVDYIIDSLRTDMKTMKRCSRVNRDWEPRSTGHLLSTIRCAPCHQKHDCTSGMSAEPCNCHLSPADLVDVLSSSPRLRNSVRRLKFGPRYIRDNFYDDNRTYIVSIHPSAVSSIVKLLPVLRGIEFHDCLPVGPILPCDLDTLQVDEVKFISRTFGFSAQAMCSILMTFSSIQKLVIDVDDEGISAPRLTNFQRHHTHVQTLELSHSHWAPVLQNITAALQDQLDMRSLRHLRVYGILFDSIPNFLSSSTRLDSLEYLVSVQPPPVPDDFYFRSLTVTASIGQAHEWQYLLRDLEQLTNGITQEIGITLLLPVSSWSGGKAICKVDAECEHLQALEQVLRTQKWLLLGDFLNCRPGLQTVSITLKFFSKCAALGVKSQRCRDVLTGVVAQSLQCSLPLKVDTPAAHLSICYGS